MSRPLRINVADGWYHVMARGLERRAVFEGEREHTHFLALLEKMVERYGLRLHAYVLMGNHYHLLVQTPHANLSQAMQWLNVSYGVWVNRRRNRAGPLFQGRFKSVPVDGAGSWALQASVYLHLNPVRVKGRGLDKRERKAEGMGIAPPPSPELVEARLAALRAHPWSSYPDYAGYRARPPAWLTCETLWQRVGQSEQSPQVSYRRYVEDALQTGVGEIATFGERLQGAVAIGSERFLERLRQGVHGKRSMQPAVRAWQRLLPFARVVACVEEAKGESWETFRDRRADWGRDVALYLGWRHCGRTLPELATAAGGMTAEAVSKAVRRMENRLLQERILAMKVSHLETALSNVRT